MQETPRESSVSKKLERSFKSGARYIHNSAVHHNDNLCSPKQNLTLSKHKQSSVDDNSVIETHEKQINFSVVQTLAFEQQLGLKDTTSEKQMDFLSMRRSELSDPESELKYSIDKAEGMLSVSCIDSNII